MVCLHEIPRLSAVRTGYRSEKKAAAQAGTSSKQVPPSRGQKFPLLLARGQQLLSIVGSGWPTAF
eukprot:1158748-Pelagomonas_calceolata.AAC.19